MMKVNVKSKKNLHTILVITVAKSEIKKKFDERISKAQKDVSLKGFRPGKVPISLIKKQFGKALYGEVLDLVLRETSSKAIQDQKIKVAGQPKIELKTFSEGKDLSYELQIDSFPSIKLKPFDRIKAVEYEVIVDEKVIDGKIKELSNQYKNFVEKSTKDDAKKGDQVVFDYHAKIDGKDFEGNKGTNISLELGKDLFIKGFDEKLIGVKKDSEKEIEINLPQNYHKKELANKIAIFKCKIISVKKSVPNKIDDNFAKKLGAKDLKDLKILISKQSSSQFSQFLGNITKQKILDEIEKMYQIEIPKNLIENEIKHKNKDIKENTDEIKKKEILSKSRIKMGLILSEIGEKNDLKVNETEIQTEIQNQLKSMPGQEKLIIDYYKKNPSATQGIRASIYENKILDFIKKKIKIEKKRITIPEAQKLISGALPKSDANKDKKKSEIDKKKSKTKKISKK